MKPRAIRIAAAAAMFMLLAVSACTDTKRDAGAAGVGTVRETDNHLGLPLVPWEGGNDYWKQFTKAAAAGWSAPTFFPIVLWYNGISSDQEAQYDKALGFNSYIGMDASTPYSLFQDNGMYWIGGALNSSFNDTSTNWVGDILEDEPDGKSTDPVAGQRALTDAAARLKGTGRFSYVNFTQMVMGEDLPALDAERYVNAGSNVASIDMYWYTVPFCNWHPAPVKYIVPIPAAQCRTASSYGKTMDALRQRDAADGKLQTLWQFVEVLNGGPGEDQAFVANITPMQLKGAVMNSLIHEARGIVYFNQSLNGPCTGGSLVRQSQMIPGFCADLQVTAAGQINRQIQRLAPVLNSQSLSYKFGPHLDTMLKVHDGYAYIFGMLEGGSTTGNRTFTLPAPIHGRTVTVIDEERTLTVDDAGRFTDAFTSEASYHIYKVKL